MAVKMKKICWILSVLLVLCAFTAFSACDEGAVSSLDSGSSTSDKEDIPGYWFTEEGYDADYPSNIIIGNIEYKIDFYAYSRYELYQMRNEAVGYLLNQSDYESYYTNNPNLIYVINEYDEEPMRIYSLQGYDIESALALDISSDCRWLQLYINKNYQGKN